MRSGYFPGSSGNKNVAELKTSVPVPGWTYTGTYSYSSPGDDGAHQAYMLDELQRGPRHYNSCYNVKSFNDFGRYEADPEGGLTYYPQLPGAILDGYTNVSEGSRAYEAVDCAKVIEAVRPHLLRTTVPQWGEFGDHIGRYLHLFGDYRLPGRFHVRRDPFDTDFSIWYVLVDLLDLKKLVKSTIKNLLTHRNSIPVGLTARDMHDKHLGLRFGIIPTVKDIQDLVTVIKSWRDKYTDIGGFSSKRFVSHDRVEKLHEKIRLYDLDDWEQNVSFTLPFFQLGSPLTCKVTKATKSSWHGQALYGFSCPEFQGWVSRLAQICDSFGVLDPAAIWDVIPFSFIVDWFFSVSTWLHKNRPRLFPATAVLYDYLETIRVDTTVTYELTGAYASSDLPYFDVRSDIIGKETYSTYLRQRFLPPEGHVVLESGRGGSNSASFVTLSNRVAIASSLIAQRLPR